MRKVWQKNTLRCYLEHYFLYSLVTTTAPIVDKESPLTQGPENRDATLSTSKTKCWSFWCKRENVRKVMFLSKPFLPPLSSLHVRKRKEWERTLEAVMWVYLCVTPHPQINWKRGINKNRWFSRVGERDLCLTGPTWIYSIQHPFQWPLWLWAREQWSGESIRGCVRQSKDPWEPFSISMITQWLRSKWSTSSW